MISWRSIGEIAADIAGDLQFRRRVEHLHTLGPQVVGRFLAEIGAERSIRTLIDQKLERYAKLSPEIVAKLDAADWPPDPKSVVDGGRG